MNETEIKETEVIKKLDNRELEKISAGKRELNRGKSRCQHEWTVSFINAGVSVYTCDKCGLSILR